MAEANPRREPQRIRTGTGNVSDKPMCECCEPAKPLFPRPDFGLAADGSALYALCLGRRPPVVHVNRGDGTYQKRDDLTLGESGNVINGPDGPDHPVATSTTATQRQADRAVGGPTPFTVPGDRVDLTRDNHYWQ